ncbi:MAG TPA: hypothetical protein VMH33_08620 [Solirubrobacterales bacterium]|nr:hypothetical protein [Solirubrobacterales bacterium]
MANRGHPRIALALVVIGSIVTFVAIFSIWANRQALNTDNWVDTSGKLLQSKAVDEQLADYLGEQVFTGELAKEKLEEVLPPRLSPLAGVVAGGIHQLAPKVAERALENPKVQELWEAANRKAHERLLEVLDGGGSTLSTEHGEVTLDLAALVTQISSEIGVGGGIAEKIPPDAGKLTILRSDQLSLAQTGAHVVRELPIFLTLLALVLFGVAVYIAGPRRRRTLRAVGFGFIVAGLLALILRGMGGNVLVDSLVANPAAKPAVHDVWDIATSLLVTIAASALTFGILVVLGAELAGQTRPAVWLREKAAPYIHEQRAAAYGVGLVVFLLLIWLAPVAAFRKPLGLLVFAVLFAVGLELLVRQTLREFPAVEKPAAD